MTIQEQQKPKIVQLCWIGARIASSTLDYLRASEPIPADQLPGDKEEGIFRLKIIANARGAIRQCLEPNAGCKMLGETTEFNLATFETEIKRVFPSGSSPVTQR